MKPVICANHIINTQNSLFLRTRYCSTLVKSRNPRKKVISIENINPRFAESRNAFRGPLVLRAMEIEKELESGFRKPFKKVIHAHVGDCHAMGQVPISFVRQVLACVSYPQLLQGNTFPQDVKERATRILNACMGNSIGSYSLDVGFETVRQSVAEFIENRDGFKANYNNIYLTLGALEAIKGCLQLFINNIEGKPCGVMVPVPQNPFYSASLAAFGLKQVDYYLNESKNWQLTEEELERSFEEGSKTCKIRALIVINPGNPSGQVLARTDIETIIKFAQKKGLFMLADEVYQHNVYKCKFTSFKKVMMQLGKPYNQTELVSFMSASHGYTGEGGIRGGWMEIVNMDPGVQYNLLKCISARLCPSTLGQAVIDCIAKPPLNCGHSYAQYYKEITSVFKSLHHRAKIMEDIFNSIDGYSCTTIQGGLYAFPRIEIPRKAIVAAEQAKQKPDVFYVSKLLEETGICVLPGSDFGQKPNSYHFRSTILPQSELLREMGEIFRNFQNKFTKEFS